MSVSNQLDINALTEMGFSRERVEIALQATNNRGIPEALEWLFSHPVDSAGQKLGGSDTNDVKQNNATAGDESTQLTGQQTTSNSTTSTSDGDDGAVQGATAMSLKCEDCGKLLKSEAEATMHASRTGHTNFAESTEEIKPLTEEEKTEQKKRLQQKLEQRRLQRLQDEKEQEKLREKTRRKTGQEITKVKDDLAVNEMKKIAEERRREKMEEKRLKQQLREQIAQDRAAFKAKNQPQSKVNETSPKQPPSASAAVSPVRREHDSCKIQVNFDFKTRFSQTKCDRTLCSKFISPEFRLPDGSTHYKIFQADDSLLMVRNYILEYKPDISNIPFTLSTTFPRKIFMEVDMSKTMKDLRLVPSSVLVVAKKV